MDFRINDKLNGTIDGLTKEELEAVIAEVLNDENVVDIVE